MQPINWFIEELHILRVHEGKQYVKEKPEQMWSKPTLSKTDSKRGHSPNNKDAVDVLMWNKVI